jgi:hypothetical protein
VTPVGVERIQDNTRWTKALGEAVTYVYGDCKVEIGQRRRNSRVGDENTGPSLVQGVVGSGWQNAIDSRPTRRELMKQVAPMRGLWHRAAQAHSDARARSLWDYVKQEAADEFVGIASIENARGTSSRKANAAAKP